MSEQMRSIMEPSARGTIVVAEDDVDLRETYRIWLNDDWTVIEATDGEGALDALDETVDVLVLDRNMPTLDGPGVVERLDETSFGGRIIVVSANHPDETLDATHVFEYLVKPVTSNQLEASLGRAIA